MRLPLLCLFAALFLVSARATEPLFQKNDVIALVGGEDMVVTSEYGYLELLLTRALPSHHLRFRNLAWEGDTVYEQHRDLNFPSWEEQLDKIGASLVVCQFGAMESLAGQHELAKFSAAYAALIQRFSNHGKRRIILVTPTVFASADALTPAERANPSWQKQLAFGRGALPAYIEAIKAFDVDGSPVEGVPSLDAAQRARIHVADVGDLGVEDAILERDGVHLNQRGHQMLAFTFCMHTGVPLDMRGNIPDSQPLRQLIVAKNKLWFNYWRVQNWAFLAGDRTNQPSSRDWRDPSKRWFPTEREEFLPLIETKEEEIDALAANLSQK
jgi:hypothetical protein